MGTRGLTMVIANAETKVAQYGQWDHYPSGQGAYILNFLQKTDLKKFKEKLKTVRFMDDEDQKKVDLFLTTMGCKDGWMNMEQAEKYKEMFPYLSRDIGSKILELINLSDGREVLLVDSSEFAGDSLFCEWGYVIDLDKNTFEVYKGFNQKPLNKKDRFFHLPKEKDYYPIKLIKSFKLTNLPSHNEFLEVLEEKEEEVE